MSELINPLLIEREDYCIKCNTKRSIELYNIYNTPIKYSNLLDFANTIDLEAILDKSILSYMKCKKCNTIYKIHWNKNKPEPLLYNPIYEDFLKKYKK